MNVKAEQKLIFRRDKMHNNSSTQPEIESKNLTILDDQMKHEALASKKSEAYVEYFADPALKSCAQIGRAHV